MKIQVAGMLIVGFVLAGCVTSGPTGKVSEPNAADASRLNLDLGISYLEQGKLEEALAKLEKSVAAKEDNSSAYRVMAYVYEQLGDAARAETNYRKAARYGPKDQAALNALAVYMCRKGGGGDEMLKYFDRALALPEYQYRHEIFTNAGTCAKDIDLALSENYLRQALALRPEYPEALFQMADVAYRSGKYLQARAFTERRLAAASALPEVLWLAQRVETELGDEVTAQTYRARLQNEFPDSRQARQLLDVQRD